MEINSETLKLIDSKFEEIYQWDKKNAKECKWNERDLAMIAEGLAQAKYCLCEMFLLEEYYE